MGDQIENAKKSLKAAMQAANESAVTSAQRVADAQRGLVDALRANP